MDSNRKRREGGGKQFEGRTKGPRRDAAKELLWRGRLDEQKQGGLSVRAYCRGAGVSESLFYQWRREISRRDAETRSGKGDLSRRKGVAGSRPGKTAPGSGPYSPRMPGRVSRPEFVEPGFVDGPSATAPSRPAFIELRSTEDTSGSCDLLALTIPSAPAPVEVVLRNGRVLRVGRGFDPDLVLELAAVLEGNGSC